MAQVTKYEKEYIIRSYECNINNELRIVTLLNIFQDIADEHASKMKLGLEYCLSRGLAWVGSNYHIKINRLPKIHEQIKIITWPSEEKKLGAIRDFHVRNLDGEDLIRASSQWILINFEKKRPVALRDNLPEYSALNERALLTDFPRLPDLERIDNSREFTVRFDDIDLNQHVNNAVYPLWATESVPPELRLNHSPEELEICFKKEAHYGEQIEAQSQMTEDMTSLHSILAKGDGRELAKIRIKWR